MNEAEIAKTLAAAEAALDDPSSSIQEFRALLAPLIAARVGAAIWLDCSVGHEDESETDLEKRYVEGTFLAAECGDLDALYTTGVFYDYGEYDLVAMDKAKASAIFKSAADRGHARCMYIHACELLWGQGTFEQDVPAGLDYLERGIAAKSGDACMIKARLLLRGEFGFSVDREAAQELRNQAKEYDDTLFDQLE